MHIFINKSQIRDMQQKRKLESVKERKTRENRKVANRISSTRELKFNKSTSTIKGNNYSCKSYLIY